MRKCDKKVKKGQGKRRQSNKGNSNDGWVGEVRDRIKRKQSNKKNSNDDCVGEVRDRIKRDRLTEGTVVTGERNRKKAA